MKIEHALARAPVDPQAAASAAAAFIARAEADGLVDVAYAHVDTPFGSFLVAATARGLVRVAFEDERASGVLDGLAARISPRVLERPARLDDVRRQLEEYFDGRRRRFELPLDWSLSTGFARKVLQATARIPFGKVSSYGEMATRAGSPRAARAAGNALGSNPIPIVVPCHRVLHTGGGLGGYGGGLPMKEALLRLEGVTTTPKR